MKKRKLRAKIRRLQRVNRVLRAELAKHDPFYRWFTAPFKMGDVIRVKLPSRPGTEWRPV